MKKKIFILILSVFTIFVGINNVKAGNVCGDLNVQYYAHADYEFSQFDTLTDKGACLYGLYDGYTPVGLRLTIVDDSGNRVAGTVSIDLTAGHRTFTGSQFQYSNVSPGGRYFASVGSKKDRYEIVSSGLDYNMGSTLGMYYWSGLPSIDGTSLKTFFETQFATTYKSDMVQIFTLMNYTGYTDMAIAQQHYLLFEPIYAIMAQTHEPGTQIKGKELDSLGDLGSAFKSGFNAGTSKMVGSGLANNYKQYRQSNRSKSAKMENATFCDFRRSYYFGTTTEVFSMMHQNKDLIMQVDSGRTMASDIETRVFISSTMHNMQGASGTDKGNSWDRAISDYGVGMGFAWMKFIVCVDDCPLVEITCPNGDPLPPSGKIEDCIPKCDTNPIVDLTNNCDDGPTGSVVDTDDWACIFKTKDADKRTYNGSFYNVNGVDLSYNPYCSVACREEIYYAFSSPFTINAGTKFTIASDTTSNHDIYVLDPGKMSGKSECKTAPKNGVEEKDAKINYEQFKVDYAYWNEEVAKAWDNYQIALKKQYSIDNAKKVRDDVENGEHTCKDRYTSGNDKCEEWNDDGFDSTKCHQDCWTKYGTAPEGATCGAACNNHVSTATCKTYKVKSGNDCGDGNFEHDGHRYWSVNLYEGPTVSYTGTYYSLTSYTASFKRNDNSSDTNHNTSPEVVDVAKAKSDYEKAVATRNGILALLKQCNNFVRNYNDFSPELTFSYNDPTYGSSFQLRQSSSTTVSNTVYYKNGANVGSANWLNGDSTDNIYGSSDTVMSYVCDTDGSPCTRGTAIYPNNDYVIQTVQKTYTYNLARDTYRYMGKNGLQSYTSAAYSTIEYNEPYRDFGYELLPVSYNYEYCYEKSKYTYTFYYGYSGGKVLFGENSKFKEFSDSIGLQSGSISKFEQVDFASNIDYECHYTVEQNFKECERCDENSSNWNPVTQSCCNENSPGWDPVTKTCPGITKGINIIYRPISLDNPFPGEHGVEKNGSDGRDPGSNWSWSFINKAGTTESAVHAFITNNRGVHTEQIYSETPMYEFVLDTANIRRIRKYNSEQNHNYTDFETLECYGETAEFCRSTFLQNGETNGYFQFTNDNPTGGTCFGKSGTTDDEWNACRY